MDNIDAFLIDAVQRDTIPDFASPSDHFTTGGGLQFDFGDNNRRLRSGHVLDFKGATLELDPALVTNEMLRTEQAPIMIGSEMGNISGKTGEDAFNAISSHINVVNVNLIGNFSKLAPRARALGVSQFSIAGCGLQGHDAHANVTLRDFGAYGREAFPVFITGADNSFDTYPLYSIDPKHTFDENTPASSLEYKFLDFVPELSRSMIDGKEIAHQVTVGMITGARCPGNLQPSPWKIWGPWRHMMRRDASLKFDVTCPDYTWNAVQGGTIYQSLHGTVDGRTMNASVMYYTDYEKSKGVHILPTCKVLGWSEYGVIIRLSPTAGVPPNDYPDVPVDFSAEDFVIQYFERNHNPVHNTDVFLNADLLPGVSKNPPTRYLRNIAIDERLTISGNKEGLVLIPAPNTKKKGCL